MTSLHDKVLATMNQLQVDPKRSLGQNFLINEKIVNKILQAAIHSGAKSIIEVGPGLGSLTETLKEKFASLFLIELDNIFAKYWQQQGLSVACADALQYDWKTIKLPRPTVLVSNLPYQISSSLVIDRSEDGCVDSMVLMFQKEVAQRIRAKVKTDNYGMLSVYAQTFWSIETLLEAGTRDFYPAPKIASRVLTFSAKQVTILDRKKYLQFVKACFLHPRKLMLSNLQQGMGFSKQELLKILPEKIRAQQLSIDDFVDLYFKLGFK